MKKLVIMLGVLTGFMAVSVPVFAEQTVEEIQIADFAKRADLIAAAKEFKAAFTQVRSENGVTDVAPLKEKLKTYYTDSFAKEYANKNKGKTPDVDAMFNHLDEDSIALQYYYVIENPNPLGSKHLLNKSESDKSTWSKAHEKYAPAFRDYLNQFGLYDIFIVDPATGDVVYTCFKELDFTTNLNDGLYAKTGLGDVFQAVKAASKGSTKLSDMAPYLPSYDVPARFVSSVVYDGDTQVAVVIFQLPTGM